MMTKFTGVPDAEGTRFMEEDEDEDEEDDDDELTPQDVKVKIKKERDLVESLLSDGDEDEDTIS